MASLVPSSNPRKGLPWRKLEELYSHSNYTDTFRSLYAAQTTYARIISQLGLDRYGINARHLTKLASRHPELNGSRNGARRRRYTKQDMSEFEVAIRSGEYRDKRGRFQAAEYAVDTGLNVRTCEGWYARLLKSSEGVAQRRQAESAGQKVIHLQRNTQDSTPTESSDVIANLAGYGTEEENQASMTLEEMDDLILVFRDGDAGELSHVAYQEEEAVGQFNDRSTSYGAQERSDYAAETQVQEYHFTFPDHEPKTIMDSSGVADFVAIDGEQARDQGIWKQLMKDPAMWED